MIQEYYAAEELLQRLPRLSAQELQREYLNYLKWTEAFGLMLGLLDQENQAIHIVELARDVDLRLAARLAGKVLPAFQKKTVEWITTLEVGARLKLILLGLANSEATVPALMQALKDKDDYVCRRAIDLLAVLGTDATIPGLMLALKDPHAHIRRDAIDLLAILGTEVTIPALVQALKHQDDYVCWKAAKSLARLGTLDAIAALEQALENRDYYVRWQAAESLTMLGVEAANTPLQQALEDYAQMKKPESLGAISSAATEQAPEDHDSHVPNETPEDLTELGIEVWDPDADGLDDSDEVIDAVFSESLEQAIESSDADGLDDFDEVIDAEFAEQDLDKEVRKSKVEAIESLSTAAASGIRLLVDAFEDRDWYVRWSVVQALRESGSEAVIPPLVQGLKDPDWNVRESVTQTLGGMASEAVIPSLLQDLKDPDFIVYKETADFLVKLGKPQPLKALWQIQLQAPDTHILEVINSIQERCQYYNYELTLSPTQPSQKILTSKSPMKQKTVLRLVVASPGDVQPERDLLDHSVIPELNRGIAGDRDLILELARWETDAYPGFHLDGPQALIDDILQIEACDILIGIFWKRFGTPTKDGTTGTEHEFLTAYNAWQKKGAPKIMMYFKQKPFMARSSQESQQLQKVLEFRDNFPEQGLYWEFDEETDFERLVRQHLTFAIKGI